MTYDEEYNEYKLEQAKRELDLSTYPMPPLVWTEDIFDGAEI